MTNSVPSPRNLGSFDMAFQVHYEDSVWWAETSAWPGFTAAADSRPELLRRIQDVLDDLRPDARWYALDEVIYE